jgi:hypothetical protein
MVIKREENLWRDEVDDLEIKSYTALVLPLNETEHSLRLWSAWSNARLNVAIDQSNVRRVFRQADGA